MADVVVSAAGSGSIEAGASVGATEGDMAIGFSERTALAAAGGGGGAGGTGWAVNAPMTARGAGTLSVAIKGTMTITAAIATCVAIDTGSVYLDRDPSLGAGFATSPKISRGTVHLHIHRGASLLGHSCTLSRGANLIHHIQRSRSGLPPTS
jgi:hypothetical protein